MKSKKSVSPKMRFFELLEQVSGGRVYRITKRGNPMADLKPIEQSKPNPEMESKAGPR
jgi:prevent-host-death family protein